MHCWARCGLLAGLILWQTPLTPANAGAPSTVRSVTARLFYGESGTFSENILDKPSLVLWNTEIVGEGQSGGPSQATLIEVEVDDNHPGALHKEQLTITAQQKGREPVTRHNKHLYFGRSGKHFEGVWLYDTGCRPVTITAQIDDQPAIHKRLDFECGE